MRLSAAVANGKLKSKNCSNLKKLNVVLRLLMRTVAAVVVVGRCFVAFNRLGNKALEKCA